MIMLFLKNISPIIGVTFYQIVRIDFILAYESDINEYKISSAEVIYFPPYITGSS